MTQARFIITNKSLKNKALKKKKIMIVIKINYLMKIIQL